MADQNCHCPEKCLTICNSTFDLAVALLGLMCSSCCALLMILRFIPPSSSLLPPPSSLPQNSSHGSSASGQRPPGGRGRHRQAEPDQAGCPHVRVQVFPNRAQQGLRLHSLPRGPQEAVQDGRSGEPRLCVPLHGHPGEMWDLLQYGFVALYRVYLPLHRLTWSQHHLCTQAYSISTLNSSTKCICTAFKYESSASQCISQCWEIHTV